MEFKNMTVDALKERRNAIVAELDKPDADLDKLDEEMRAINAELEARAAAEAKKAKMRAAVAGGAGTTEQTFQKEKRNTADAAEVRKSAEYVNAYANYVKTGDDTECRALLSDNATGGTVPVPTFVEGIVADMLKASPIMARVTKTYAPGNVKMGFERNAPIATVHAEGSGEQAEEALQLGIVELVPETIKKWVSISDEALDSMSGEAYLRYLYSEIGRKIIKAEEKKVIDAILAAPQTATATKPAVAKYVAATPGVADIINARALVTADVSDLVVICTPAQYAQYKTLMLGGGFAFDPFDGLEVLFSDAATVPIIGDLSGVVANYPNGDEIKYKYDDRTLMTSDLVRVLGRKPVAIGVVGNNYFAKITEA